MNHLAIQRPKNNPQLYRRSSSQTVSKKKVSDLNPMSLEKNTTDSSINSKYVDSPYVQSKGTTKSKKSQEKDSNK